MFILLGAFALLNGADNPSERTRKFSGILSVIFTALVVIGQMIWNNNNFSDMGSLSGIFQNALKFFGFYFLYDSLLIRLFARMKNREYKPAQNPDKVYFTVNKRSFFLMWGIIFLAWLPCLLAYWPGTLPYDAPGQARSSLKFSDMNMHHPIIHTAFIGVFYRIALNFDNPELLPILYALAQMLIMSAVFSFTVCYMAKIKLPFWFRVLSLSFYAFYPFNSIFSIVMAKDELHAGAVCLFFISLLSAALNPKAFFKSKMKMFLFILAGFLFVITRNNAWPAFLICIPALLFCFKKFWLKTAALLLAVAALHIIYNAILISALHVWKGPVKETFPFLAQQLAYVVTHHKDSLSEKDLADIYDILPEYAIPEYSPRYADPVKGRLNEETLKNNPGRVIFTWLRIGVRYPVGYTSAFLSNCMGFWYIDAFINDPSVQRRYIETSFNTDFDPLFERKSKIPFLLDYYESFARFEGNISKTPILVTFMSVAFPLWLLILLGGILIYKNNGLVITLAPLAALLFTVMLGPLAYGRYIYPFTALYPMLFGLPFLARLRRRASPRVLRGIK
jgi:hypothetical protein